MSSSGSGGAAQKQRPGSTASRWGWVSGAVAGLESRLDTILDAGEGASAAQRSAESLRKDAAKADRIAGSVTARADGAASRDASTPRQSVQLPTERTSTDSQPKPTTNVESKSTKTTPPKTSLDATTTDSTVVETQPQHVETATKELPLTSTETDTNSGPALVGGASLSAPNAAADISLEVDATATDARDDTDPEPKSVDTTTKFANGIAEKSTETPSKTNEELQEQLTQARSDHERVELRRQEETHEHLERIDALQAKLRYLAREASTAARQAARDAGDEGMQKRLAEQDDKITQLMEEGIKLSKSEVSQTGALRNLRAKTAEDSSAIADLQRRLNRAERQLGDAASDVARLERERAQAVAKASRLNRIEREVATLREEATAKDQTVQRLQRELRNAAARADDHQKKLNEQELDKEKKTAQSLREDLANAKIEQTIRDDRAKTDAARAKEQLQRETERHRAAEAGLRSEMAALESRVEVMRERSEEASSGTSGDAQAKLMRQIEVLQSQYAVASENQQGIEASLHARVAALERERDDSARHETDARKKAREAGAAARKLQDRLDDAAAQSRASERELDEHRTQVEKLHGKSTGLEKALEEAKADHEREKQAWNASLQSKLEEERAKAQQKMQSLAPSTAAPSMADGLISPGASLPGGLSQSDLHGGISARWLNSARGPAELASPSARSPHHYGRRSSNIPPPRAVSEVFSIPDEASAAPTGRDSGTPTARTPEPEMDVFESAFSPGGRNVHDVVSTSTAGAGPSVQLVERMSASVRRLETEKAAARDELARLQTQRDEARRETVALMAEVEAKREVDRRAERLQRDCDDVRARFERMAEMFGEKTERCEELEADVADLKTIYRELVERTMTR